ncbi:MAG TPA: FlgD immunoglobulin-like domain containing protein [Candidatus Kapabacteria bacterium]|nr:FlgD immunoglobulin-like domain containing protein [Candidatus Kapabacteria bacterium]
MRIGILIRNFLLLPALMVVLGISLITSGARAQAPFSGTCFPTCDSTDARMLSIAGAGINTLAGQDIVLTVAVPATASTVTIGIFDPETSGRWDIGTVPLEYTVYADPNGDGTGTFQVLQFRGDSLNAYDNRWYNVTINNVAQARTQSGAYYYTLKIRTTDNSITSWSSFKVRTDAVIYLRPNQAFAMAAPLSNLATAQIVYPNYPTLTPTTYDGNWTFYLNVQVPQSELVFWDGDFDYGDYQCTNSDEDDADTPNGLPSWIPAGTQVVNEGVAQSAIICANGDTATSNPTDDSQSPVLRREPNIFYELIDPYGTSYVNGNPSGNLEWEQFRLSTAPFDRDVMDYQADSIPPGIWTLNIMGMDLQNLDAMRFGPAGTLTAPYLMGVDTNGSPVLPPPSVPPDTATVSGKLFFDANSDGQLNNNELGIPGIPLFLYVDYNNDNVVDATMTTTTDATGAYLFKDLRNSHCQIVVDSTALGANAIPTADPDGIATRHRANVTIDATHQDIIGNFGYRQYLSASINGLDTVEACVNSTYTSTVNDAGVTYSWSISGAATIVGAANGSTVTVHTNNFGTFKLTLTVTKNGSTFTTKKTVVVAGIDFALLGYHSVYFKGRCCGADTTRGVVLGNVGVNLPVTGCNPRPCLTFGTCNTPAYNGDGGCVRGDYCDLSNTTSVWDLCANRSSGTTCYATKRHSGPTCFTAPIINPLDLPKVPSFTVGCNNITVSCNGSRALNPGTYGVITISNGGTLTLANGIYNIRSIRGGSNITIVTQAGTKVRIGRDLLIGSGYVGPYNSALFIVRSDGVTCGASTVDFGTGTEFHGQVFAPNGTIDLGSNTTLTGRFWGDKITSDCNVRVVFWTPVNNLTHGNNDGFQKKLISGAVTGSANKMLQKSYPNPFTSSTTLAYSLSEDANVTIRVVDASGRQVRTLLDNANVGKGDQTLTWDGRGSNGEALPNGTYFFNLEANGQVEAQPVVLVR